MKIMIGLCFKITLFAYVFLLIGCSHHVVLRDYSVDHSPIMGLETKRVVVVLEESNITDTKDSRTDIYVYKFSGIRAGIQYAFQSRLGAVVKELVFIQGKDVPKDYDLYLYPRLEVRTVHDFWTMGCLVRYQLDAKSSWSHLLATASLEGKKNFMSAYQAENKCRQAMEMVFDKVTNQVLNSAVKSLF